MSRDEWRTYVETVSVRENFPGINGLGWIQPVESADLERFLADDARRRRAGFPHAPARRLRP